MITNPLNMKKILTTLVLLLQVLLQREHKTRTTCVRILWYKYLMSIICVWSTATGDFYLRSGIDMSYVYSLTGHCHIAKRFLSRWIGHEVIFERVRSLKKRLIALKRRERERGGWAIPINRVPSRVDCLLSSQVLVSLNGYLRSHCRNYFIRTTVKPATLLHARRAPSSPSSPPPF